jgi:hypothetical protein
VNFEALSIGDNGKFQLGEAKIDSAISFKALHDSALAHCELYEKSETTFGAFESVAFVCIAGDSTKVPAALFLRNADIDSEMEVRLDFPADRNGRLRLHGSTFFNRVMANGSHSKKQWKPGKLESRFNLKNGETSDPKTLVLKQIAGVWKTNGEAAGSEIVLRLELDGTMVSKNYQNKNLKSASQAQCEAFYQVTDFGNFSKAQVNLGKSPHLLVCVNELSEYSYIFATPKSQNETIFEKLGNSPVRFQRIPSR